MDDSDDLEAAVRELSDTLEQLRTELRRPPTGPLGLPRPPKPGELLRFTEQYTIPALVSLLDASVRVLELLAAAIRVADGRPPDGPDGSGVGQRSLEYVGDSTGSLAAASRTTLERLDGALAELQEAAEGGRPDDPQIRSLLADARDLRAEIDSRLADVDPESGDDGAETGDDARSDDEQSGVDIDVDEELKTIRRQVDPPDGKPDDGEPGPENQG
jgi:hypothetical protein